MSIEDTNTEKNYEVGYKKPPKAGQFKKGHSGNPRGSSKTVRARKAKKSSFGVLFSEGMHRPVEIQENGKKIILTRLHLGIRRRVEEAAKGKLRVLKELLKLREVKEMGPLVPERRLVFTLDEAGAAGPLGITLYRPNVVILREPKPQAAGAPARRKPKPTHPALPRRPVAELIEIEFDRQIQVTDAATGATKRMSMREVIAEQLMLLFAAGKPGTADLLIKLNKRAGVEAKEDRKIFVGVPWDYQMPPRLPKNWRELGIRPNPDGSFEKPKTAAAGTADPG